MSFKTQLKAKSYARPRSHGPNEILLIAKFIFHLFFPLTAPFQHHSIHSSGLPFSLNLIPYLNET